jgi:hypothetical protein
MKLSDDHQALVDFFASITLPTGFQHVNEYSVFLDLPGATEMYIRRLYSDVDTNRQSAALALTGIKEWAIQQDFDAKLEPANVLVSL